MSKKRKNSENDANTLQDEPYILYENSLNKNTDFLEYRVRDVFFHSFLTKVLHQGLRAPFNFDHMFKIPKYLEYDSIIRDMNTIMTSEYKKDILNGKKSIYDFYQKLTGFRFKMGIFLIFISEVIVVLIPTLLKSLISWLEVGLEDLDGSQKYEGLIITALISLVVIISKLSLFSGRFFLVQAQVHGIAFAFVSLSDSSRNISSFSR